MIATSSIAISPVNEDPAIPSKVTYKYNTKQWEKIHTLGENVFIYLVNLFVSQTSWIAASGNRCEIK